MSPYQFVRFLVLLYEADGSALLAFWMKIAATIGSPISSVLRRSHSVPIIPKVHIKNNRSSTTRWFCSSINTPFLEVYRKKDTKRANKIHHSFLLPTSMTKRTPSVEIAFPSGGENGAFVPGGGNGIKARGKSKGGNDAVGFGSGGGVGLFGNERSDERRSVGNRVSETKLESRTGGDGLAGEIRRVNNVAGVLGKASSREGMRTNKRSHSSYLRAMVLGGVACLVLMSSFVAGQESNRKWITREPALPSQSERLLQSSSQRYVHCLTLYFCNNGS